MTTHNNTPKDQYHRAPLNVLIIGAITPEPSGDSYS